MNNSASAPAKTILFVDDEPGLRSLIREILLDARYQVLEAASGQEALKLWGDHRGEVSVLLTDLSMPGGVNGDALALQMLRDDPALKIIITSGSSQECHLKQAQFRFLPKPYQPDDLLDTIQQCLQA